MLVNMAEILEKAVRDHYAVAAVNVWNGESVQKCFEAASELRAPTIINVSGFVKDMEWIAGAAKYWERKYPEVPAALNLDHGFGYEMAAQMIHYGYTSVMIDKSSLPFEENVRLTKEVVKMAHSCNVSVEGEIGHVGGLGFCAPDEKGNINFTYSEDDEQLTTPEEAVEFIKQTGVDCLAVSVGTVHGTYKKEPKMDFERLAQIKTAVDKPLVIHGASYSGDENLRKFVEGGAAKINIFSELAEAGLNASVNYLENEESPKIFVMETQGLEGYKAKMIHFMKLFGQANRW
ncbi:class II fructose-bisphosphate aldolase [Clostridium sp. AM58-1XD]|uniref:class II fructose-bisphosphate aldolase n=1 Tax=Clostridium sp. AM58-1XD TaxID=2292307 RepID=UPI000E485129|nr:class II fructose-bisphosphate aldolase [Clostridium sp. AM58-1XD]RGY99237.1 class II fructose-bisphosphate aldolase [Clostridium sp. AM58-1XD]